MKTALAWIILAQIIACIGVLLYIGPIAQDETYHAFADQRAILRIPNFWNVISNLPFAFVGALGLLKARDLASRLLFTGVFLTAFGSAYYHWSPDDSRLVWDRLPMTVVFMSLLTIVSAQRFSSIRRFLIPFVLLGVASVIWWRFSGDLRPYAFVQFAPTLMIPAMLLLIPLESSKLESSSVWWVILFYALAKLAESADAGVFRHFPLSGHTLKHLLAATSTWFMTRINPR